MNLDITNSGTFVLESKKLLEAMVIGYYEDSIDWTDKRVISSGTGVVDVKNNLKFRIEFSETPDI